MQHTDCFRYWGKASPDHDGGPPCHLLPWHMLDVAAVAQTLIDSGWFDLPELARLSAIPPTVLRRLLLFFICLHDLGKFAHSFQTQVQLPGVDLMPPPRLAAPQRVRHDVLGWRMAAEWLQQQAPWQDCFDDALYEWCGVWLCAVTGHHGKPGDIPADVAYGNHFEEKDLQAALQMMQHSAALWLDAECAAWLSSRAQDSRQQRKALTQALRKASWRIAGLCVLADWLGSRRSDFAYHIQRHPLEQYYTQYALPRAQAQNAALGFQLQTAHAEQSPQAWLLAPEYACTPLQEWASGLPLHTPIIHVVIPPFLTRLNSHYPHGYTSISHVSIPPLPTW